MKIKVGFWIDHRKTIIVAITNKGEEIGPGISKVEKQPGRFDHIRCLAPYAAQQVRADDSRQRK